MFSLLICLCTAALVQQVKCASVHAELIEKRDNVTTLPMPIVAMPSQHWEGVDGRWSTFAIRVGTPAVVARVLPATSWQEVWVIANVTDACNATLGVASDCQEARGGTFNSLYSKTWVDNGTFSLGLNNLLGYEGYGQYGFDTVGLGFDNSTGVSLPSQFVSEITSDQFWFGQLGLGFQPSNVSEFGNPKPSFSESLFDLNMIASKSWSYTAGAAYRLKTVYGSLIFGGLDTNRFTPNNLTFTMGPDNLRDLIVTIRGITATTTSGNTTLMSSAEFAFIDSTVAEFWLPVSVCQAFEKAFSLTVDPVTNLYLLDASTHAALLAKNPNITFTLANQKTGGTTIDIVLPYASFDLNVTAPIHPNGTSYYFPLRAGQNDSMYTLGRTFLQEAYVTTHYNSRTFNVSQAKFPEDGGQNVVAVPSVLPTSTSSPDPNSSSPPSSSQGLGGGAIAGIVLGALFVLGILGLILFCCRRRGLCCFATKRPSTPVYEIDSGRRIEPKPNAYDAQASAMATEISGNDAKYEIGGNPIMHPQELEAEVPMLPGHRVLNSRVNGASDSSGKTTDISSESNSPATRRAEMIASGFQPSSGEDSGSPPMHIVSPTSPTIGPDRGFGRGDVGHENESADGMPEITVTSPGAETNDTWTPRTPIVRRSEEGW